MLTKRFEVWSCVANVSMEVVSVCDTAVEDLTHEFTQILFGSQGRLGKLAWQHGVGCSDTLASSDVGWATAVVADTVFGLVAVAILIQRRRCHCHRHLCDLLGLVSQLFDARTQPSFVVWM